ncbi:MAG TPA: MBL fold metallo-hydrolase [Burkholderiales bacterium]|jgi:glyoxylase-like metal-dependent hydrolase (beta-lactamase superfamily II)/8-oxo-dGTP pyrophosphatase MutT (NUDIX family)|nr:MBL fold metallo-hydrolase [Burkholderiales bacterium]
MMMAVAAPRPAATLILLRSGAVSLEALLLQRSKNAVFLGGAYVFPGGAVDASDDEARRVLGLTDAQASERLGLGSGALAYYVAAVRECFEEAGVLLACDASGKQIPAERAQSLMAYRHRPFLELLEAEDLYVPAGALAYYGHWITAPGRTRRFDTRFFVALAPEGQQGAHDANETVHDVWIGPREALERGKRGEIELVFATKHTLVDLARFSEPRAAFEHVRSLPEIPTNRACWAQGAEGPRLFRRADPQYFEIHWSDPEETGQSSYDLAPGVPKRLDRYVTRITAPNPGMMTGPGTNTYLVGEDELALIDPGPAVDSHIERILSLGKIRWILCTHTHLDHSPAAAAIKAASGATVFGRPAPAGQDGSFSPDEILSHNDRVQLGSVSLRAIHTPGHASNHLCYLLEQTRMLFTGDHVMQGSTVVINPPDGDMRAYLRSLEMLLHEDLAILAPGHGYLIGDPHKELRRLAAHRLMREAKVRAAIGKLGAPRLEEMLPLVYDDVPARLHHVAARSLTAHLDKLVAEGVARAKGGRYSLV